MALENRYCTICGKLTPHKLRVDRCQDAYKKVYYCTECIK